MDDHDDYNPGESEEYDCDNEDEEIDEDDEC